MALNPEHFDCAKCTHKHCDEAQDGTWPESKGPANFPILEIEGVGEYRTCLLPMITPWARRMLELHTDYGNRLLPWAGGTLDQPAAYLDIMRIIEGRINDHRKRKNKSKR